VARGRGIGWRAVLKRAALFAALISSGCTSDAIGPAVVSRDSGPADARAVIGIDLGLVDASSDDARAVLDAEPEDAVSPDASIELDASEPIDAGPRTTVRYPIVFVHGWGASPTFIGFGAVGEDLLALGHQTYVATVPPFDSVEARADILREQVDRVLMNTGASKVNLVAHSMGGLDSRHLISVLGYGDRVASLSTISTPHRGTALADVVLGLQAGASTAAVDAVAAIYGSRVSELGSDPNMRASLEALSEANAPAFEAAHPDDPRVYYQSWAGLSKIAGLASPLDEAACDGIFLFDPRVRDVMDPALVGAVPFVAHGLSALPNDGFVTIQSAKWGNFRGCIPADHADEVGAFDDRPPDRITGFDFLAHYRALARELVAMGF
jgi:triacylglycerol lipase